MGAFRILLFAGLGLLTTGLFGQSLKLKAKEDFRDIVEPIITEGEKDIYKSLPDFRSRKYFQNIFWYKRNPTPATTSNPYRREFFERRQIARDQFAEADLPGFSTERGQVYLLLGDPDDVVQNKLDNSGLRTGYEEIWIYNEFKLKLRFIYDGVRPNYVLMDKDKVGPQLERIRNLAVLDRAEPYFFKESQLTLPNLGFTKDIENLVADDKRQLEYELTYAFFKGDLNRTELFVGVTFKDASDRGMDIHLAAYDPYDNKVEDFKKRVSPKNGQLVSFSVVIEPDQYDIVLRLMDRDGRESIDRQKIDVPRIALAQPAASSLLAAPDLQTIPLQGFQEPKKFVFEDLFFPITNDWSSFKNDRLYLMQHFYNFTETPKVTYYLDHQPVEAKLERMVSDHWGYRTVVSIPLTGVKPGQHHIKSAYRDETGQLAISPLLWNMGAGSASGSMLTQARVSDKIKMIHPAQANAELLERVVLRPDPQLKVKAMYVFLNGRLITQQDREPWEVFVDSGQFSISGVNTITAVMDTNEGLFKVQKELIPLKADEKIQTRVVQIYFNAFDPKLKFISDLDLKSLSVEVDGEPAQPKDIMKVDEPITYCYVVDTSYSMKESFEGNISAIRKFIQSMRPQDRGYFVGFNSDYHQYMEPNQSKDVLLAVAESLQVAKPNPKQGDQLYIENETYIYDAVISSIHTLHQYSGRKVIILVSDGIGKEGHYRMNAMLSYARENDVVIYSLWLDNNPELSDDETKFLQKETGRAEKVVRAIGLSRFFAKKDSRKNYIGQKIRKSAINQGAVKILAEESGGFHYRIFKADRSMIRDYIEDIESAVQTQYVMNLELPVSIKEQEVDIFSSDPNVAIRSKTHVKVRKSNPLAE